LGLLQVRDPGLDTAHTQIELRELVVGFEAVWFTGHGLLELDLRLPKSLLIGLPEEMSCPD
jgi:hypothetical protein